MVDFSSGSFSGSHNCPTTRWSAAMDSSRLVHNQHERSVNRRFLYYTVPWSRKDARQCARTFSICSVWGPAGSIRNFIPGRIRSGHHTVGKRVLASLPRAILVQCVCRSDNCPFDRALRLESYDLDTQSHCNQLFGSHPCSDCDGASRGLRVRFPTAVACRYSGIAICPSPISVMGGSAIWLVGIGLFNIICRTDLDVVYPAWP